MDVYEYAVLDHDSLGLPQLRAESLSQYREAVVRPSLAAIEKQIQELEAQTNNEAMFFRDDLAALDHLTIEGYLLAVQSMWERGLRDMLISRDQKIAGGEAAAALQSARWNVKEPRGLQAHFQRLMGIELMCFDSYADLDLLQNLGNAIRHGDGRSAARVHELAPSLYLFWLKPGTVLKAGKISISVPPDGPQHPSFKNITLPGNLLEQMIESVRGFWLDLEHLRCASFPAKNPQIQSHLSSLRQDAEARKQTRTWSNTRSSTLDRT